MYSVAYHYAKDLDSDVVVTSRRPTLFAYYSELFELISGKLLFCFRTTRCSHHPLRGVGPWYSGKAQSQPRHAIY
jgi:hypothetical protein